MSQTTKYNPQIHHRRSIRLKGYDYSQAGLYFITICCQNRACLFGEITVGANCIRPEMKLNEFGIIAKNEWIKTPQIRNNVTLHEFVIMPNHMHGIIELGRGELHSPDLSSNECNMSDLHSPNDTDDTTGILHSPNDATGVKTGECNSPLRSPSQNIGAIVRGYKHQ